MHFWDFLYLSFGFFQPDFPVFNILSVNVKNIYGHKREISNLVRNSSNLLRTISMKFAKERNLNERIKRAITKRAAEVRTNNYKDSKSIEGCTIQ